MTKGWLLLLLLLIISCQSVDSQSTDETVCDGEDEKVCYEKQLFVMQRDTQRLQMGKSQLNPRHVLRQLLFPAKTSGCCLAQQHATLGSKISIIRMPFLTLISFVRISNVYVYV